MRLALHCCVCCTVHKETRIAAAVYSSLRGDLENIGRQIATLNERVDYLTKELENHRSDLSIVQGILQYELNLGLLLSYLDIGHH